MRRTGIALLAWLLAGLAAGCGDDASGPGGGTFVGPSVAVGAGRAWSWVTVDAGGKPLSLGVTLDDEAFEALPAAPVEYVLALPRQASPAAFDHIGLDWNPHGHEPGGVYDVPHFDMHFYRITAAERDAITMAGADTLRVFRQPEPQDIPAGYVDARAGVPRMGNHWIDPASPEFQPGGTFTKTFINIWVMNRDGTEAKAVSKESFRLIARPGRRTASTWRRASTSSVNRRGGTSVR